jgi:hypothetical protein
MVMDLTNEIMSPKAYKLEKAIRDMGNTLCPKCKTGHVALCAAFLRRWSSCSKARSH